MGGLVSAQGLGLVAGIFGKSVPECLGAEGGEIKAGLPLRPSLRTRSLTFLARSWGGGGCLASSPSQCGLAHSSISPKGPALSSAGRGGRGRGRTPWERVGTLRAGGSSLPGIPAGLPVTCGRDGGAGWPGGGGGVR